MVMENAGCYLVYENDSSGRLMAHFSADKKLGNALGFWMPGDGKKIQGFKFKQNSGRAELVRGCAGGIAGRKLYYTGWVQFIKSAKNYNGKVMILPKEEDVQSLDVRLFGYTVDEEIIEFEENKFVDIAMIQAVACLPKGENIYEGIQNTNASYFLIQGSRSGYSSSL